MISSFYSCDYSLTYIILIITTFNHITYLYNRLIMQLLAKIIDQTKLAIQNQILKDKHPV